LSLQTFHNTCASLTHRFSDVRFADAGAFQPL